MSSTLFFTILKHISAEYGCLLLTYSFIQDQCFIYRFSQAEKRSSHFFPHVPRAQGLAPARTRTRVVRLRAQCTDHWTTGRSRGVGVPAVQLTTHVKSSTLYGRKSKFFRLDELLLLLPFCIIMELRSASSAIIDSHKSVRENKHKTKSNLTVPSFRKT